MGKHPSGIEPLPRAVVRETVAPVGKFEPKVGAEVFEEADRRRAASIALRPFPALSRHIREESVKGAWRQWRTRRCTCGWSPKFGIWVTCANCSDRMGSQSGV